MRLWLSAPLAIFTLVGAACGGGGGDGDALDEAAWAAGVCAIAQDVSDRSASTDDGVDPTTLSLEERKERAERVQGPVADILEDAADEMKTISPPSGAKAYHEALTKGWEELAVAFREAVNQVTEATSTEDMEAANASLNIVYERVNEETVTGRESLSDDAVAALRGVNKCGEIID